MSALPSRSAARAAAAARPVRRIDLVLAGARGRVATALRAQLEREQPRWREELGLDLQLVLAFDRRALASCDDGLPPDLPARVLAGYEPAELDLALRRLRRSGRATVLLDCTDSDAIADRYPALLADGIGIVTANKRANARSLESYRQLQRLARANGAPFRYETTAGAALPLIASLRSLRLRGERVMAIEGVLSGSLSFVLDRVQAGATFSSAVAEAGALGYTEPDPREDLGCGDLLRKLLVLAREAGLPLEAEQIVVAPLFAHSDRATLGAALSAVDAEWRARAEAARARGERLVACVRADRSGGHVGLETRAADDPLARVVAGENLLRVRTGLQDAVPLTISGRGAGPDVTASGLLGDLLDAVEGG